MPSSAAELSRVETSQSHSAQRLDGPTARDRSAFGWVPLTCAFKRLEPWVTDSTGSAAAEEGIDGATGQSPAPTANHLTLASDYQPSTTETR